jgi:hypothetical protein
VSSRNIPSGPPEHLAIRKALACTGSDFPENERRVFILIRQTIHVSTISATVAEAHFVASWNEGDVVLDTRRRRLDRNKTTWRVLGYTASISRPE